ncbi:MAG: alternative ribosome rescue aminoacyl-tRNA hydrolase ArfB [Prolixibacteraceae bacterium]
MNIHIPDLENEFVFQTSRSSGPGGQNVNKVNSRVELRFDVLNSVLLTEGQKGILQMKLASKLTSEGVLIVASQESRSQLENKELSVQKLYKLISGALKPVKKRKPTRPTKSSEEKRLQKKKLQAEKKVQRGRIDF